MKRMKWLMLVATVAVPLFTGFAQTQAPQAPVTLSPAASEVAKLTQSGTSEDVLLAYVQNSTSSFSLTADQILYLRDIGVPNSAVTAMMTRDQVLRNQPQQYSYEQKQYGSTTPAPAAPVAAAPTPVAETPVAAPAPAATVATAPPPPPTAAPAPVYVSTPPPEVTSFYQDLSPYGTWVDLPGYGWCWQPTAVVANAGWRPYCDAGHWMWTDAGWYWVSDYSWGWAPFHYGRWHLHERCGWVWMPDRVWGPAWVSWRSYGDYCGWAPLPPRAVFDVGLGWSFNGVHVGVDFDFGLRADHFCFIGFGDFCSHDFRHHRLPPHEVTRVYNRTTIINNYVVNNRTIVNQGVKVERVAAATHTEIHKATIRDLPAGSSRASRVGVEKGAPVVYRPQLHTPAKPVNMVAQKVDVSHPVIQHTEVTTSRTVVKSAPAPARTSTPMAHESRQVETSKGTTRSFTEKATPARIESSAPKAHQATPSVSTTPAPSRTVEVPRAEPRVTTTSASAQPKAPVATRPSLEDTKPATQSVPNYKSTSQKPTYPLHTSPNTWNVANSPAQNAHSYYPKTYQQSAEVRSLPSANGRDSNPSSSSGANGPSRTHAN
jgi:hypothetical protein